MSNGKIYLVGLGPGSKAQMTARARSAVAEAEVVIGYKTYIRLIDDLLEGKEVIEKGMAEELDRCTDALAHARAGRTVALVSSGDVGVFGMAGPMYEVLFQEGWRPGEGIEVEVVPGVTALSASASVAGAPLTHDFCAVSLSDMLTPWPVIAKRLEAAARADFVTALYNPKSSRRPRQIVEARDIFLRHRDPATPVAVVRAAYRRRQDAYLTTLAEMAEGEVTMLTTLIIGNSSSFVRDGVMVTPRGYHHKYDGLTGEVKSGEAPRVSLSSGLEGWRRGLAEAAAGEGIEAAIKGWETTPGQVLEALIEAGGEGAPRVERVADAAALLEGWLSRDALTLCLESPGRGRVAVALAAGALRREGETLRAEAAGWELQLPWAQVAQAYRVVATNGEAGWFLGRDGEALFRFEK